MKKRVPVNNYLLTLKPHMPILGSSNSAANTDMTSKNIAKWGYVFLIE